MVLLIGILGILLFPPPASDSESYDLTLSGRLVRIADSPNCGHLKFSVIAEYSDLRVFEGVFTSDKVWVVHECPELKRAGKDGTLEKFCAGDYHLLHL